MRVKVLKMNIKTDQTKENERYGLEDEFKDVLEEERMGYKILKMNLKTDKKKRE